MEKYSAKLTGAAFLYNETKIMAKYVLDGEPIKELRKRNVEENLIHYKSKSAISRVNSPIFERISVFNNDMLYDIELTSCEPLPVTILPYWTRMKLLREFRNIIFKEINNMIVY